MKMKLLKKAVSLCLVLCLIVSLFGVYPVTAATVNAEGNHATRGESTDSDIKLIYNRDFEDNKAVDNGLGLSSSVASDAIEKITASDGNSYLQFNKTGNHDYLNPSLSAYSPSSGSVVVQFDFMIKSDTLNLPGIFQFNPRVRGSSSDVYPVMQVSLSGGKSHFKFFNGSVSSSDRITAGEWYTLTFVWSYTDMGTVTCTAFSGTGTSYTYTDVATPNTGCTDVRPGNLRIGTTGSVTGSWCLDNFIIYTTAETDPVQAANHTVYKNNHGVMYPEGGNDYVDPNAFNGNYFLKAGVLRGLDTENNLVNFTEAPFKSGNQVYIPTSTLEAFGLNPTVSENIDGVECVSLSDVHASVGLYAVYSSMGLICLTESDDLSFDGLDVELIPVMKRFIFDSISTDLTNTNVFDVSDMISLDHPYLFANQTRFDELKAAYENPLTEPVLYSYLVSLVNAANNVYKGYANETAGEYTGMKRDFSEIAYVDAYGYDVGGRQGDSASHNERIAQLAFGYQITRNENLARLAYDYAVAIGKWEHWGPGHFLNCADASAPYAMAYDWLYDAWVDLGLDVKAIEEVIFTHSLLPAYYSIHDNGCPWYDPVVSTGWRFNTSSNNWNAVCSSGITLASLVVLGLETEGAGTLLDIEIDGVYNPEIESFAGTSGTITRKDGKTFNTDQTGMNTYQDYAEYLINACMFGLANYGMVQYAPDGSYIESNGYWSYGTNNFFEMVAALTSATGHDYGLLDCWGIDRTCYYAINTQSGDFLSWNYHDSGSVGAQDTSWFQYLGGEVALGDKALAGIRKRFLESGGGAVSRADAIYYMTDEEIGSFQMPDIQYYMEGIDGYAIRDSWDKGSIFAGIMGNTNTLGHGQIDSGAFVYYSNGTRWFCDVGTENYNSYGFWGSSTRYTYYKMNAEGNNTLLLTSQQSDVPYGQTTGGFGYMTHTYDNEYGAYTIIDNTSVYGGYADYAYRGMLFTNDRRTVVIQDEVRFGNPQSVAWVGHTMNDVILSVDGKTAYMYNGEDVLKVTIIDGGQHDLKFEVRDTYDFLLDCCVGPTWSVDNGGQPEGDRSAYKRLVIQGHNITELKLAVVIEEVALGVTMNGDVGYSWVDMHSWVPTKDGRQENTELGSIDLDGDDLGTVSATGSLEYSVGHIGTSNAVTVAAAGTDNSGGAVLFTAKKHYATYGSFGTGKVVIEADISTVTGFPEGAALGIYGKGGEITSLPLSSLGSIEEAAWVRVAIVLDEEINRAYYFLSGVLVGESDYPASSLEDLSFAVILPEGCESVGTVLVDNVRLRYYTEDYSALDNALENGRLSLWAEATEEKRSLEGKTVVATLIIPNNKYDTPLVDVWGGTVYAASLSDGSDATMIDVYSFSALEALIDEGVTVELKASNTYEPIEIHYPCTVITGEYDFRATSDSLIATKEVGKTVYEEGSITVNWVIDGSTTVTEVYTGSVPATYKGTLSDTITEVYQGNNTYSYFVKDGWARTSGGSVLSEDEMIVTSANCTFYLTDSLYDGLFVTVASDGTITGYTEPREFYQAHIVQTGYKRVSLTNSFYYDSTSISDSHAIKSFNLYLNGYTLYYHTDTSSDHMFTPNNATCQMNVYGPGEINSSSTAGNILYGNNGDVYMENVTLTAPRSITDTRQGTNHFKNCTINITKASSAFSTNNRNNAVTDSARFPTVIVDGCTVNIPESTASTIVFSIWNNSRIEVRGGTVISTGITPLSLFQLCRSTTGTVENFDYENCAQYMQAIIGEAYYSCKNLYTSSTNDPSGTVYDNGDKLYFGVNAAFEEYPENPNLVSGTVIARRNNASHPYVVVSESITGQVNWDIGGYQYTELWLRGETPSPTSKTVLEMIEAYPPSEGMRYSFSAKTVTASGSQTLSAVEIPAFDIKVNMSLTSSFNLNIFVPVSVAGIEFTDLYLDGVAIDRGELDIITIEGSDYYKLVKENLSPGHCAQSVLLSLSFVTGGENMSITTTVSVPEYAKKVLESEAESDEAKALVVNILKYAVAAYVYTGNDNGAEYLSLKGVYDSYKHLATASVVEREVGDLSGISDAIDGAYLNLTDVPTFRFKLKEGYTGKITVQYYSLNNDGEPILRKPVYEIKDGKYFGLDYIEVDRKAFDIIDDLTIITNGGEATYNLATYYHHTARELGELTELVNALYAYCEAAKLFRESETAK